MKENLNSKDKQVSKLQRIKEKIMALATLALLVMAHIGGNRMKKSSKVMDENQMAQKIKAQDLGNKALTVATLILVCIDIVFSVPYAPLIILLMSGRIVSSVYLLAKAPTKKAIIWCLVWVALMAKSIQSYSVYLLAM